ncbi:hypothetical protein F5882DRAFT_368865 [Hyaloscypha sp. PMI_1271]|nr:hypothetical protein F5882DRAFT_368865 [Hyaloscypha sp. PMI_1271]
MILLKDEDAEIFKMFYDWLYTGNIPKAPTTFRLSKAVSEAEMERHETELLGRFDAHVRKLCKLYCLGERYETEHLLNNTIDTIQDAFHEYGTVFGPGLILFVFEKTQKGSKLRELCIAANVIHIDRGCGQLREELMMAAKLTEDFLPEMMKWISRNFVMFGRRQAEGFNPTKPTQGFSMLNRKKLCPCHFHKHTSSKDAHKGHNKCAVPYNKCGHSEEDDEGKVAVPIWIP